MAINLDFDTAIIHQAREDAFLSAKEVYSPAYNLPEFISELNREYKLRLLSMMPKVIEQTRAVNKAKQKENEEISNKGKFTDSYGWSDDYSFKATYDRGFALEEVTTKLFDSKFWSNDNSKVWRKFMFMIMRGDAWWEIFLWLKRVYGLDPEEKLNRLAKKIQSKGTIDGKNDQASQQQTIIKPGNI